jgi:hypothetical protein
VLRQPKVSDRLKQRRGGRRGIQRLQAVDEASQELCAVVGEASASAGAHIIEVGGLQSGRRQLERAGQVRRRAVSARAADGPGGGTPGGAAEGGQPFLGGGGQPVGDNLVQPGLAAGLPQGPEPLNDKGSDQRGDREIDTGREQVDIELARLARPQPGDQEDDPGREQADHEQPRHAASAHHQVPSGSAGRADSPLPTRPGHNQPVPRQPSRSCLGGSLVARRRPARWPGSEPNGDVQPNNG